MKSARRRVTRIKQKARTRMREIRNENTLVRFVDLSLPPLGAFVPVLQEGFI
jgi:hypothetical protein